MENDEVIKSFALAIISSGLLNALTSHLLYSKKLEKENTYKENLFYS